jgi:hypothetical protein
MAVQQLTPLILSDDERAELASLTMRRKTAQALALRARIVLTCAEGGQDTEVAAKLGLDRQTVGKWRSQRGAVFRLAATRVKRASDLLDGRPGSCASAGLPHWRRGPGERLPLELSSFSQFISRAILGE